MSPGWVGCHPSSSRVRALEAGLSAREEAGQPGEVLGGVLGRRRTTTGRSRWRPITSAMSRIGTPSSATPCSVDPAGAASSARRKRWRGVEAVHGRPTVGPVADVAGHALVAGDVDQGGDEAVVPFAVHRRREPHNRRADAARGEGEHELGGGHPGLRRRRARPPPGSVRARRVRSPPARVPARASRRR